jgi:hypothetical protein
VIYGIYNNAIDAIGDDELTKGIFASYPSSLYNPSMVTLAFDQVIFEGFFASYPSSLYNPSMVTLAFDQVTNFKRTLCF